MGYINITRNYLLAQEFHTTHYYSRGDPLQLITLYSMMNTRQIYCLVSQALQALGFRSKSKQELVDITSGLFLATNGTKDALLNNIARTLSEAISLDIKTHQTPDINIPNLVNIMRLKNVPKNMEPMLKEIFIQCRKSIKKKMEHIVNNINNSIATTTPPAASIAPPNPPQMMPQMPSMPPSPYNNNSMYSYSPTVQNYNFMYPTYPMPNYPTYPYFYPFNFMNYKGNGFPSSMYNPLMSMPQFPQSNQVMNVESNVIPNNFPKGNSQRQQKSPDLEIITPPIQKQLPKKVTDMEPVPQSEATAINAYIEQNNLPFSTNQNFYRLSQVQSKKKEVSELPKVEEKQKSKIATKQPTKAPIVQPNLSKSMLSTKSGQLKVECICNNTMRGTSLKCLYCVKYFHIDCLNMKHWSKRELQNFQCPSCAIRKMDPLHQVKAIILEEIVNFKQTNMFNRNLRVDSFVHEIKEENQMIEVRSIRLDGHSSYEISWPDFGAIHSFDKHIDFKPLQYNSSIKKRKEETLIIDKAKVIESKTIPLKIEVKQPTKDFGKNHRIREQGNFIVGIYLVKKNTATELIDKISHLKISYEESKSKIHNHFKINEDIYLEKLSIKLVDPISLGRINIPARGIFCQHPQCFSLDTFILMVSKLQHRSWKCPICNYRCYSMYRDTYTVDILSLAGPQNEEVEFYQDGTYTILDYQDDDDDEEKPKAIKKQIIQEVIIDDEDEVQVIENPPAPPVPIVAVLPPIIPQSVPQVSKPGQSQKQLPNKKETEVVLGGVQETPMEKPFVLQGQKPKFQIITQNSLGEIREIREYRKEHELKKAAQSMVVEKQIVEEKISLEGVENGKGKQVEGEREREERLEQEAPLTVPPRPFGNGPSIIFEPK